MSNINITNLKIEIITSFYMAKNKNRMIELVKALDNNLPSSWDEVKHIVRINLSKLTLVYYVECSSV